MVFCVKVTVLCVLVCLSWCSVIQLLCFMFKDDCHGVDIYGKVTVFCVLG